MTSPSQPTSPSVDGETQINALNAYTDTEEADVTSLLSQLGLATSAECNRVLVRSFRKQMIIAGSMAALSRSEAPAAGWVAKHRDGDLGSALSRTQQDAVSLLMRSGIAGNHGWGVIPLYAAPSPDTRVREAEND